MKNNITYETVSRRVIQVCMAMMILISMLTLYKLARSNHIDQDESISMETIEPFFLFNNAK